MEKQLESLKCTACGSGKLKKISRSEYICEYCGSRYFLGLRSEDVKADQDEAQLMPLFLEAQKYERKDAIAKELEILLKGLEIAPDNSTLMLKLGRAYWRLGLLKKASEYLERARQLDPNDPVLYNNIALLYISSKDYEKARLNLEKSFELIKDDPLCVSGNDEAIIYGNYGMVIGKLGNLEEARKYLRIAKEKGYSDSSIKNVCKSIGIDARKI